MRLPAETHYELPGTYVLGAPQQRRTPRVAVAGIVLFVLLVLAAIVGAVVAGRAIFGT